MITCISHNARYVKYRGAKKPSFPDFGPFHGFWSRPGSGFGLETDFAFLWLNCVFCSLVGVFDRKHLRLSLHRTKSCLRSCCIILRKVLWMQICDPVIFTRTIHPMSGFKPLADIPCAAVTVGRISDHSL